jgi:hypothetical protein
MGAGIAAFLLVPLALAAPITSLPGLAKLPAWKMDAGCERPAKCTTLSKPLRLNSATSPNRRVLPVPAAEVHTPHFCVDRRVAKQPANGPHRVLVRQQAPPPPLRSLRGATDPPSQPPSPPPFFAGPTAAPGAAACLGWVLKMAPLSPRRTARLRCVKRAPARNRKACAPGPQRGRLRLRLALGAGRAPRLPVAHAKHHALANPATLHLNSSPRSRGTAT